MGGFINFISNNAKRNVLWKFTGIRQCLENECTKFSTTLKLFILTRNYTVIVQ
jgi:hypothetical protein